MIASCKAHPEIWFLSKFNFLENLPLLLLLSNLINYFKHGNGTDIVPYLTSIDNRHSFSNISDYFALFYLLCKSEIHFLYTFRWKGHWFWSVSRWGAALNGWGRWPDGCYAHVLQQWFSQHIWWTRCSGHFAHSQWHAGVLLNHSRFVLSKTYRLDEF